MSRLSVSDAALRRVLEELLGGEPRARGRVGPREANVEALQTATGLARGTVHNALSNLAPILQQRSHRPGHSIGARGGKPTVFHRISSGAGEVLVVQLDHDRVTIFSVDASGTLVQRGSMSVKVDDDPELAIREACERIAVLDEKKQIRWERMVGLGVSMPAPVDPKTQRAIGGVLPEWEGVDVAKLISKHLGAKVAKLPVIVDNDGNLAALAEHRYGTHIEPANANLLFVKTVQGAIGIGGGAVIHGQPLRGGGLAMELGHLPVEVDFKPLVREWTCPHCGRVNCLQARLSTQALIPKPKDQEKEDDPSKDHCAAGRSQGDAPSGDHAQKDGPHACDHDLETHWETVVRRALDSVVSLNAGRRAAVEAGDAALVAQADGRLEMLKGDPDIKAIVFAAQEMGRALAKVVTLIDPEIIAVGGPLGTAWLGTGESSLRSAIGDPLRESLREHVPLSKARTICLREATVTHETARGAAAAVFDAHLVDFLLARASLD